jgi:hypothetical protein
LDATLAAAKSVPAAKAADTRTDKSAPPAAARAIDFEFGRVRDARRTAGEIWSMLNPLVFMVPKVGTTRLPETYRFAAKK